MGQVMIAVNAILNHYEGRIALGLRCQSLRVRGGHTVVQHAVGNEQRTRDSTGQSIPD